ncbi:MAG: TonB-dependent receptor [Gammaproteobacteria bacterium]|nr:TonB-dependent receptor [Chloroflexota bacterium]MXW45578.1 TonB-dependent receptor [Gammaproteobacteria bacterium]MYD01425.1 TonB-dependent receptor [Gammaproteobacteria bacterium]MYI24104.1 TonB-dependent receptor [Gammaproteobacteria bacterium]
MTRKTALIASIAGASLIAISYPAPPAFAQELGLEEIVVTARKREENLQDLPLTVTALTNEDIYERGVTSILDLADYTPGFYTETVGRRDSNPYFRGLVVNTSVVDRQNSSVFVDGYFVLGTAATFGFNNIERVEVLKGPQSALFGRATFGGAVNYITKSPGDELAIDADIDLGQDSRSDVAVTVSGPLLNSNVLKGMLSIRSYSFGGEWTNVAMGEDNVTIGDEKTRAISGKLLFEPSENLAVTLSASYAEDDDGPPPTTSLPNSLDNCLFYNSSLPLGYICGELPDDLDTVAQNNKRVEERFGEPAGQFQITRRYTAELDYVTSNDWEFELRAGANQQVFDEIHDASWSESMGLFNGLGGFGGLVFGSVGLVEANKAYQGFQDRSLQVKVTVPGSDRLSAFVGASTYEHDILGRNLRITPSRPYGQIGSSRHIENVSVFGSVTYSLTEKLALGLDVRWQKDDVRESTAEFEPQTLAEVPSLGSNEGVEAFEFDTASFKRTLPRFIVDYKPNEDITLYGVISQGNKPGFFNNRAVALNLGVDPTVKEETIWNYEAGVKSLLMNGRLLLNAAFYYLDWSNQQIRQTFLDMQGQDSQITTNAGETEVYGIELESSFVVSERLILSGSVAFADPEYKFFVEETFAPQLGVDPDLAGNEPYRYPDWQIQISADYNQPGALNNWDFFARSDLNMTGERWSEIYNLSYIGWEYKWNLRAGLQNENWRLTAYVNNILDDRTLAGSFRFRDLRRFARFDQTTGSFTFPYAQLVNLNRGRHFGVNVSYSF